MSRMMSRSNDNGGVGRLYADPFQSIEGRMNQLFRGVMDSMGEPSGGQLSLGNYPVDVDEDEDKILIEAEMPGFKSDEVDVHVQNGVLTIKAERQSKPDNGQIKRHMSERRYTRIERAFTLPRSVDGSDVQAHLEDGVLTLQLNKSEQSKPRKISIGGNKSADTSVTSKEDKTEASEA